MESARLSVAFGYAGQHRPPSGRVDLLARRVDRLYQGRPAEDGLIGERNREVYPIWDDAPVPEFFQFQWKALGHDPSALAHAVLSQTAFWGQDLSRLPGMERAVASGLQAIQTYGMRAAVEALLD